MSAPPSTLQQLQTAQANLLAQLASITANPKPNYSLDGQSVSWMEYQKFLLDMQQELNRQIQIAGGVLELQTQ
jgi:hypothetical protein